MQRWTDRVSLGILIACMVAMAVGFVHAQTVPVTPFEAALGAQMQAMAARVDKLESMWNYAMIGIFGNLVSHVLQLQRDRSKRHG